MVNSECLDAYVSHQPEVFRVNKSNKNQSLTLFDKISLISRNLFLKTSFPSKVYDSLINKIVNIVLRV